VTCDIIKHNDLDKIISEDSSDDESESEFEIEDSESEESGNKEED